jgi:molybdate transport system substrate-binding protein
VLVGLERFEADHPRGHDMSHLLPSTAGAPITRRRLVVAATTATILIPLTSCTRSNSPSESTLTVFAAASLIKSFDKIKAAFERVHPGVKVEFSYASSWTLAQQIVAGAPADVYAAADPESMAVIAGLTTGDPSDFATNTLLVAVPPGNPGKVTGIEDLARPELRVGLCDPSAPCGRLAAETLTVNRVNADVDTFEANNQSLFTRLQQGELDAALIYKSDAINAQGTVLALPPLRNAPVDVYQIAALRTARNQSMAQAFVDFVLSTRGQAILTSNGFGQP